MRILYLFPKPLWCAKMSPGRRWYGESVARQPGVELEVWGEGWDGYDNTQSLRWNLNRREPFDVCWAYKPDRHIGVRDCGLPVVVCYNESWPLEPDRALNEVLDCGASLVVHHHANDADCFDGFAGRLVNIPHGAPVDLFYSTKPHSERRIDCLVAGVQAPTIYPLRSRFAKLVSSGRLPGLVRKHPGYRLASLEACAEQERDYAAQLGDARVSLCCTSRHKYLLAKIAESMLSGCIVVTDAAEDPVYREHVKPYVVEIDVSRSDDDICGLIQDVLADREWCEQMAKAGQQSALNHLTTDIYARRFVSELQSLLACRNGVD